MVMVIEVKGEIFVLLIMKRYEQMEVSLHTFLTTAANDDE
jgi:hypothetical protein